MTYEFSKADQLRFKGILEGAEHSFQKKTGTHPDQTLQERVQISLNKELPDFPYEDIDDDFEETEIETNLPRGKNGVTQGLKDAAEAQKIMEDFSKVKNSKPKNSKKPLFTNGKFKKNTYLDVLSKNGSTKITPITETTFIVEKKKDKKKRKHFEFKLPSLPKISFKRKKRQEKPVFTKEQANRFRRLAGIPIPQEPVRRSNTEKFRIKLFELISPVIWRIHPDTEVRKEIINPSLK